MSISCTFQRSHGEKSANVCVCVCVFALRNLQKTVSNKKQLRFLTGEWFYETKQRRHKDRIHGSDLIRASMRQTNKPLTICESVIRFAASPSQGHSKCNNLKCKVCVCTYLMNQHIQGKVQAATVCFSHLHIICHSRITF